MKQDDCETTPERSGFNRRHAVKTGSGIAIAALVASMSDRAAIAQVATPGPLTELEGRYVVIRARKLKADRSAEELIALVREGFVPIIQQVPGFVAYYVVANPENGDQFGIGIYADKAGADESNARAAEWGALGAADYVEGDPIVIEGPIDIAVHAVE